jgi:hypothetical protein
MTLTTKIYCSRQYNPNLYPSLTDTLFCAFHMPSCFCQAEAPHLSLSSVKKRAIYQRTVRDLQTLKYYFSNLKLYL